VELLIVVAIIALLISTLAPSLRQAKMLAKRAVCASNVRQVNVAMSLYLLDYQETYPCAQDPVSGDPYYWLWMGRGWRGFIAPYLQTHVRKDNPSVLLCPADPATAEKYEATSYAYSLTFYHSPTQIDAMSRPADTYSNPPPSVAQRSGDVANPTGKILIGEWTSNHQPIESDGGWWCWQGSRNFLLADGHIEYVPAEHIRPGRDEFPDANLTVGGITGQDLRH